MDGTIQPVPETSPPNLDLGINDDGQPEACGANGINAPELGRREELYGQTPPSRVT